MRFSKVLLVNPKTTAEWKGLRPPAGLGYIAQALQDNDIEYDIFDMQLGYSQKKLFQKIAAFKPDIVGFSLISHGYKYSYSLIEKVKTIFPDIKIVVGGPHVTIYKKEVLQACKAIDFAIAYEGERALVELCRSTQQEKSIKGLIFRHNGNLIYTGDRDWILDVDSISFPHYHKFELHKYIREMQIFSSRGCPHRCLFCARRVISPYFRPRNPENVVNEIEYWYEKGYRQFNFEDDNFGFYKKRVYLICDEIEKRGLKKLYLRCSNGLRADKLDKQLLMRMKEVGFQYIAIGVDGGNNRVLKIIKKGETIEQIERSVKNACELGFDVKLFFIIGHPGETVDDVEDSFRLAQKYPVTQVHLYKLIPYPGTEVFEQISKNDYFLIKPERYLNEVSSFSTTPFFETPELPAETRVKLLKKAQQIEKEVTIRAIERMYNNIPHIGRLMGHLFASNIIERMIYNNFMFRKLIEYVRYRKAVHD